LASTRQCPFCGATVRSDERTCPGCGAANDGYVADTARTVFLPKTIGELKEYCAQRGMPLLRMRFFIGEDYRQPKAFGIYKDGDRFVVYKNKANGERAVRYEGPDEEYAVGELFAKLLEECHNRGIYPDGKPDEPELQRSGSRKKTSQLKLPVIVILICLVLTMLFATISSQNHRKDGYYRFNNTSIYYRYGSRWYTSDDDYGWHETTSVPSENAEDYYLGKDYDSDWGESDFKRSSAWEQIQEKNSSSSSDYDSWDSNDTDWDSDW